LELLLSWSGGKDSALALHELRRARRHRVAALLTTVTEGYDRISMHGVRRALLHAQAGSLGLPLEEVWIPRRASNLVYESRMRAALERYLALGVKGVAFGDLFLADVRAYRETRLKEVGMKAVFPLWHRKTDRLAERFIDLGFRAVTCCVDPRKLSRDYCGAQYDREFLDRLPVGVDPCGENGEFHTFVYDGPVFKESIDLRPGRIVKRGGFYFADLLMAGDQSRDSAATRSSK
jgi:uncharacterized protein (TIGR00290 family)